MVVDAVCSEPVSGTNSLLNREFTGKLAFLPIADWQNRELFGQILRLAELCEPPETGAFGMVELPSSARTCSRGTPRVSAATWVIVV